MDFPRPSKSVGEIFSDLKDKISFQGRDDNRYYEDEFYDDESDFDGAITGEENDYGPYGYEASDRARSSVFEDRDAQATDSLSPRLVSARTARASAAGLAPDRTEESAYEAQRSHGQSVGYSSRTVTSRFSALEQDVPDELTEGYDTPATAYRDFVSPYKEHQQQASANAVSSVSDDTQRFSAPLYSNVVNGSRQLQQQQTYTSAEQNVKGQTGLDKLFMPSDALSSQKTVNDAARDAQGGQGNVSTATSSRLSDFVGTDNESLHRHVSSREVTVLKPVRYDDVKTIAPALRSGAVVALALRLVNDALARRILDFSFGVASALDAQVECPSEKVFVLFRGAELTLEEKHELRKKGI